VLKKPKNKKFKVFSHYIGVNAFLFAQNPL